MTRTENIIVTGFMGTGKSTIGALLAERMGRTFVDMDALIEEREGRTIREIFATHGEPYFRRLEAELCRELAAQVGLVIATGGGTLVPPENLQVMAQSGPVICLDCTSAELWQRIGESEDRPMLADNQMERFAVLADLLAQRQPAYQQIPHHVDVTYFTPKQVVDQIMTRLESL